MTTCLMKEKERVKRKELELRARVFGLEEKVQEEKPIAVKEQEKVPIGIKS